MGKLDPVAHLVYACSVRSAVAVRKVDVVAETREEDGEVRVHEREPAGDATGAPAAGGSPGNAVTCNV